jgi:hypothetical protein
MLKLFYQSTWYLTLRSFQRRITSSYGKLRRLEKIEKAEFFLSKHVDTQQDVLTNNLITCFHVGQIVESPFIFHKTQNPS